MLRACLADAESPPPPRMLQAHSQRQRHTFLVSLQEAPPPPRMLQGAEEFERVFPLERAFPLERKGFGLLRALGCVGAAAGLWAAAGFVVDRVSTLRCLCCALPSLWNCVDDG